MALGLGALGSQPLGGIEEGAATFTQAAFRWGNDDGSESAYTFIAAQNVDISQAATTAAILRYLVDTTGDTAAVQMKLQVKRSTGAASEWRAVPVA